MLPEVGVSYMPHTMNDQMERPNGWPSALPRLPGLPEREICEGFNTDAFRLDLEIKNYDEGRGILTEEGIQQQLNFFLGEYLTNKGEFKYEYYFNEHFELIRPGWNSSAISSFQSAVKEPGLDTKTKLTREAELQSFTDIENILRYSIINKVPVTALLQSPKENYPGSEHSFVSFYEVVQEENAQGEILYTVKVRNRRIYHCQNADHVHARQEWLKIPGAYEAVPTTSRGPVDLLGSALVIPPGVNFENLMELYGDFQNPVANDEEIQGQLENFQPEVERFQRFLCSFKYEEIAQPGPARKQLIRAFKLFLIKARVHFSYEEAKEKWGEEIVDEISKAELVYEKEWQSQNPYNNAEQRRLENNMLALKIAIGGSCGNAGDSSIQIIIGDASVSQIVNSFYKFTIPGRESSQYNPITRPHEFTCTNCGCTWFVENSRESTHEPCCPHCGRDMSCGKPHRPELSNN